jgi:hypothetical protein
MMSSLGRSKGLLIAGAGALIVGASLLPWVTSINSLGLADESGITLGYGLVTLVLGIAIVALGIRATRANSTSRDRPILVILVVAVLATAALSVGLLELRIVAPRFGVFGSYRFGIFLVIFAAIVAGGAALTLREPAG